MRYVSSFFVFPKRWIIEIWNIMVPVIRRPKMVPSLGSLKRIKYVLVQRARLLHGRRLNMPLLQHNHHQQPRIEQSQQICQHVTTCYYNKYTQRSVKGTKMNPCPYWKSMMSLAVPSLEFSLTQIPSSNDAEIPEDGWVLSWVPLVHSWALLDQVALEVQKNQGLTVWHYLVL